MNRSQNQVLPIRGTGRESDGWRLCLRVALEGRVDVPPLSQASAAIAALAADGEANTTVLAGMIERDPTVAAHVLRVANSAALAPRVPIVTVPQAIAWLGMGEIQAIATSVAVRSRLFAGGPFDALLRPMWRRAVATAYWAREIARPSHMLVDLAHLCGLLCRIGRPVVIRCLAHAPDGVAVQLDDAQSLALVDEFEAAAGAALCRVWSLPEPVSTAICTWRDDPAGTGWERQLRQVRLADLLAARTLDEITDPLHDMHIESAIEALQLHAADVQGLQSSETVVRQALDLLQ